MSDFGGWRLLSSIMTGRAFNRFISCSNRFKTWLTPPPVSDPPDFEVVCLGWLCSVRSCSGGRTLNSSWGAWNKFSDLLRRVCFFFSLKTSLSLVFSVLVVNCSLLIQLSNVWLSYQSQSLRSKGSVLERIHYCHLIVFLLSLISQSEKLQ